MAPFLQSAFIMPKKNSLRQTYNELLAETYELEVLLVEALPRFCFLADSMALSEAFEKHQKDTWKQLDRLETLMKKCDPRPNSNGCKEARKLVKEADDPRATDLMRIAVARKIERYEIDAYEMLISYAGVLADEDAVEMLKQSLKEEKAAEAKFNKLYNTFAAAPQEKQEADTLLLFLLGADS